MRNSMFRRYRRLLAVAMTCIVAFAGTVTAAHACALTLAAPPAVASAAEAMPDCVETAPAADTAANACEAHCVAGQSLEPLTAVTAMIARLCAAVSAKGIMTVETTQVVTGFFDQVLTNLPVPGVADALRALVGQKLDRQGAART